MIAVGDRRDGWVGPKSWPSRFTASPGWKSANLLRKRNGALFGVHGAVRSKSVWQRRHC